MTCNTPTTRHSALPELLEAQIKARQRLDSLTESHNWAADKGYTQTADLLWIEVRAAYERWWDACDTYERARIEELYPVEAHS